MTATVPCGLCGDQTPMTATARCDRCHELEKRIEADPELALVVLCNMFQRWRDR